MWVFVPWAVSWPADDAHAAAVPPSPRLPPAINTIIRLPPAINISIRLLPAINISIILPPAINISIRLPPAINTTIRLPPAKCNYYKPTAWNIKMFDCRLQDSNRLQQPNISASNILLLSSRLRYRDLNIGQQPNYHMPLIRQPPATRSKISACNIQQSASRLQHLIFGEPSATLKWCRNIYQVPLPFIRWHNYMYPESYSNLFAIRQPPATRSNISACNIQQTASRVQRLIFREPSATLKWCRNIYQVPLPLIRWHNYMYLESNLW